ncbi:MAG: ATP-binding protein [Cyanobacteriota bacterium]|nr:ATP-binding protein [Cyanobacteriota bacterium]
MESLRCHLLIGPPASGKTTTARALAPLLSGSEGQSAVVLSTDALRAEVFGDAAVQGPWGDIQQRLHQRLIGAVAAGMPVIVDATHAERAWRLAITQQLPLPRPVEWIGWRLFTSLSTCLRWNAKRERPVPPPVIRGMAASLQHPQFGPDRGEGFAAVVAVQPTHQRDLTTFLRGELARLNRRISAACNRQRQLVLHGHSRLLDLERLLHLLRLLADHPDLATTDQGSREQLETLVSPLPSGDLAQRAAALLAATKGVCYGDVEAVRRDLAWLDCQGFFSAIPVGVAIQPLPPLAAEQPPPAGGIHGGHPAMADAAVFVRVMTLLRHLLQNPFDAPGQGQDGPPLQPHLLARLNRIPGGHGPGELETLRKDIEKILTPYGFRPPQQQPRHGYCLGTALLSAPRLVEIHAVVQHAAQRLGDPTARDLLQELEQRLAWGGIAMASTPPLRAYHDGSTPGAEALAAGTLAEPSQAERIETAILEHRRVRLLRLPPSPSDVSSAASSAGCGAELRVWPLQLVLAGGLWHLAWEQDAIGRSHGLLQCERLERLQLLQAEPHWRRNDSDHNGAIARLQWLLHHCGGTELGDDGAAQDGLCHPSAEQRRRQLQTLRCSFKGCAYGPIRQGQLPLPLEQIRVAPAPTPTDQPASGQCSGQGRIHPALAQVLPPNPPGDSHPHPVEIDLPPWILARGIALRRWLFSHGSAIRIEAPQVLRQEQQGQALEVLALGQQRPAG